MPGRFSDHNLFGTGKILDLLLVGDAGVTRKAVREYATRLGYFDPSYLAQTAISLPPACSIRNRPTTSPQTIS
jgi:hypothetical protein